MEKTKIRLNTLRYKVKVLYVRVNFILVSKMPYVGGYLKKAGPSAKLKYN